MPYLLSIAVCGAAALTGSVLFFFLEEPTAPEHAISPFFGLWGLGLWALTLGLVYQVSSKLDQLEDLDGLSQYKRQIATGRSQAIRARCHEIIGVALFFILLVVVSVVLEVSEVFPYGSALAVGLGSLAAAALSALLPWRWLGRLGAIVGSAKRSAKDAEGGRELAKRLRPKTNGA